AVGAFLDPPERFLDGLQDFRVGLLQLQLDVDFVVAARLIGHIALACVVLHRRLERLDSARPQDFSALLQQLFLVCGLFHGVSLNFTPCPFDATTVCRRAPLASLRLPRRRAAFGARAARSLCSVLPGLCDQIPRGRDGSVTVSGARHSARSVESGLFRRTSRLEKTPIAETSIAVSTTPAMCSVTKTRHGISRAYRLTPPGSAMAPTQP